MLLFCYLLYPYKDQPMQTVLILPIQFQEFFVLKKSPINFPSLEIKDTTDFPLKHIKLWDSWNLPFEKKIKKAIKIEYNNYVCYHYAKISKNINTYLNYAQQKKNITIIKFFINLGYVDTNTSFNFSCEYSFFDIIKKMLKKRLKRTSLNFGLECAIKNNNYNIVKLLFTRGIIYEEQVYYICRTGKLPLFNLLIKFKLPCLHYRDLLSNACFGGNLEIVKFALNYDSAIENLWDHDVDAYNFGLIHAIEGKKIDIVRYLIKLGANNLNDALIKASRLDNIEIVELLIKSGANDIVNALLSTSDFEISKLIFDQIKVKDHDFSYYIEYLVTKEMLDSLTFFIKEKKLIYDNNRCLVHAIVNRNFPIFKLIVDDMLLRGSNIIDINQLLEFNKSNKIGYISYYKLRTYIEKCGYPIEECSYCFSDDDDDMVSDNYCDSDYDSDYFND